jgi:hypothetical protein
MACSDVADLLQVLVLQYGRYWNKNSVKDLKLRKELGLIK